MSGKIVISLVLTFFLSSCGADSANQERLAAIATACENVKADEYSGSKFKTYTVIDTDVSQENRSAYLYDMGTASRIGSAKGNQYSSPHPDYYNELMKNKLLETMNFKEY